MEAVSSGVVSSEDLQRENLGKLLNECQPTDMRRNYHKNKQVAEISVVL